MQGEIRRALPVRIKEHQDATRLDQRSKSAVADHAHKHDIPHSIDWKSVTVIDKARSKFNIKRKRRESFYIHRQLKMNGDQGVECCTAWNSVLWSTCNRKYLQHVHANTITLKHTQTHRHINIRTFSDRSLTNCVMVVPKPPANKRDKSDPFATRTYTSKLIT